MGGDCGRLETPEKIRELQRKLYLKAKQEKKFRFYLLYDKVYRMDILRHSYQLVRANKGACGVDNVTFESIEEMEGGAEGYLRAISGELRSKVYKPMPVRRVYIPKTDGSKRPLGIPTIKDRVIQMAAKIVIEPVFEADFQENSYGFRPKRNAHQAMDEITLQLRKGNVQVIDADITKYFDTIPHDKLLGLVAKRIVDKHILRFVKMWLKAPVVEEGEDGKKRYKGNDKGTPQGGVISPLLANIYLSGMDEVMENKVVMARYKAKLIRYCDDFVVMCRGNAKEVLEGIKVILGGLELSLNEEKTKVVDARHESFDFLGFTVRLTKSRRTGRMFPLVIPSKKSVGRIRKEIKRITCRRGLSVPKEVMSRKLNKTVRGWTGYFYYGSCSKTMNSLKSYLEERVRIYLKQKYALQSRGYRAFPNRYFYECLGLYKIPLSAPWTRKPANALGRR